MYEYKYFLIIIYLTAGTSTPAPPLVPIGMSGLKIKNAMTFLNFCICLFFLLHGMIFFTFYIHIAIYSAKALLLPESNQQYSGFYYFCIQQFM